MAGEARPGDAGVVQSEVGTPCAENSVSWEGQKAKRPQKGGGGVSYERRTEKLFDLVADERHDRDFTDTEILKVGE